MLDRRDLSISATAFFPSIRPPGVSQLVKGLSTYDVNDILGFWDPLPLDTVTLTQPISTIVCSPVNPPPRSVRMSYVHAPLAAGCNAAVTGPVRGGLNLASQRLDGHDARLA